MNAQRDLRVRYENQQARSWRSMRWAIWIFLAAGIAFIVFDQFESVPRLATMKSSDSLVPENGSAGCLLSQRISVEGLPDAGDIDPETPVMFCRDRPRWTLSGIGLYVAAGVAGCAIWAIVRNLGCATAGLAWWRCRKKLASQRIMAIATMVTWLLSACSALLIYCLYRPDVTLLGVRGPSDSDGWLTIRQLGGPDIDAVMAVLIGVLGNASFDLFGLGGSRSFAPRSE